MRRAHVALGRALSWKVSFTAIVGMSACLPATAQFTGTAFPPATPYVPESRVLPPGYRKIGSVEVNCGEYERGGGLLTLLDNWSCDSDSMRAKLRKAAMANGGSLLVGAYCDTDINGSGSDSIRKTITCKGDVARQEELIPPAGARKPAAARSPNPVVSSSRASTEPSPSRAPTAERQE